MNNTEKNSPPDILIVLNKLNFYAYSKDIGIVSDYVGIPGDVLVKNIVNFLISVNKKVDINYLNELINLCGINEILNIYVSKLSSGQKRKLEIFSSMIKKKKI